MPSKTRLLGILAVAAAIVAGCSSSPSQPASSGSGQAGKKYSVVLSNNYMGNEWRPQMENAAKAVAESPEYSGVVDLQIRNVDIQPSLQIASLQAIIRQKPDAILVDAASPTALNPTLEQACAAGIKVIAFDQVADTPCAYKLPQDYAAEAADMVNWLGTVLHGKGNILMDTGLPGIPISTTFVDVWKKTLAEKYPDIKVVGTYSSQYAPGPELQGVSQQLAANTRIDGILSGGYISSQIAAFQKAGRTPVPATGLDVNGNMQECERLQLPCFYIGAPSFVGGMAVEHAVKVLTGQDVPKSQVYWSTNYVSTAGNVEFAHQQQVEVIKEGTSYFANGDASLVTPLTYGPAALTAAAVLGR
ncbi:substrate-binding domain-containing protein [Pseudonocardia sp. CA-107938]|uniref:substrate-binding domain-containing protein n=1 Tax=Pseudonocardia sp. CA-107938 TaxID=3240021 RepID=UPI003D8D345A